MKAILVKIVGKTEKVCATPQDAINFLLDSKLNVNEKSTEHLNIGFEKINLGSENKNGGAGYHFSAGNNPGNPTIYLNDVSEITSILEMSPENIKNMVKEVEVELQKIKSDFKLNTVYKDASVIEGGFSWYWSQSNNCHYAIHELWMRTTSYQSTTELKAELLKRGLDLVKKYA